MLFAYSPAAHRSACAWKQRERQSKIDSLPAEYFTPLSLTEQKIHSLSLSQLVSQYIMLAYAKRTLQAHNHTNCVTDFLFDEALHIPAVANWGPGVDPDSASSVDSTRDRLLMGVPVSIKDTIDIAGHDSTVGFSRTSSAIVRLLQDAGALVHVKTTIPTGLLAIETTSDIFGYTTNPYSKAHTAGASTGGGAALVACGGSKIEIGTDIGGSVRIPAHFCGIWSLKGSMGRFPNWGTVSSMPGLESVPICKPWDYDHTCIPLPWRPVDLHDEGRKLKWGVIWDDGTIPPTPACKRALSCVVDALRAQGHEVVTFNPPNIPETLNVGYELVFSDGGAQIRDSLLPFETLGSLTGAVMDLLSLPRLFKKFLAFITRSRDPLSANLIDSMHTKTILQERALIARRDKYRAAWHDQWRDEGLDFVLTVPHALPALARGSSEKATLMSAGYSFLFSLLDYTSGVMPVTFVDKDVDALPENFFSSPRYQSLNTIAKGAYSVYDAATMHGLPVGVQVAGRRLEEEKVLEGMKVIEGALCKKGTVFAGKIKM
ncbi:amidase signature domain-containing protein [Infundibulicybe gibba]|nr:amidase signature domain-containing protein [Infundibulicybe gibba]